MFTHMVKNPSSLARYFVAHFGERCTAYQLCPLFCLNMHLNLHAALAAESYEEIKPVVTKAPQLGTVPNYDESQVSSALSRLEQLTTITDPLDSDLSTFVDLCIYESAGYELRVYLLIGKRWKRPDETCFVNELPKDQYYKKTVLAATDRIPELSLTRLSSIVRQKFAADSSFLGWEGSYLDNKFGVGMYDYSTYPSTFHFHPGFHANFSVESTYRDAIPSEGADVPPRLVKKARSSECTCDAPLRTVPGRAQIIHDGTGIQTLAASVVLTENETVDILDYLTSCCRGLHKDLQRKVDHGAKRVFRHLAFRRCKAKLEMPQAAGVCQWATHVHLQLAPFDKEVDLPAKKDEDAEYNSDEEYANFDNSKVLSSHKATAMSALSTIAHLPFVRGPDQSEQQRMLDRLLSGTFPVQLHQQSEKSLRSPSGQELERCQHTPTSHGALSRPGLEICQSSRKSPPVPMSEGQSEAVLVSEAQAEAVLAPQTPALACATAGPAAETPKASVQQSGGQAPLPRSTQLLQINMREVIGFGGTGTVFAGQYQGKDVAVKVTNTHHKSGYSKALRTLQEVWAYQQLQAIPEVYGSLVPELLAFAELPYETFILVMTKQGQILSDYVDQHGQVPDKEVLLSALSKLHKCGVIHGSPRFDNITLRPGSLRPCFVDLQRVRCRNYKWDKRYATKIYDRVIGKWREPTYDEQLDAGTSFLTDEIIAQVKLRQSESEYFCELLEHGYSDDATDCRSFQRSRFKVDY